VKADVESWTVVRVLHAPTRELAAFARQEPERRSRKERPSASQTAPSPTVTQSFLTATHCARLLALVTHLQLGIPIRCPSTAVNANDDA
jgi:hypothetical protein